MRGGECRGSGMREWCERGEDVGDDMVVRGCGAVGMIVAMLAGQKIGEAPSWVTNGKAEKTELPFHDPLSPHRNRVERSDRRPSILGTKFAPTHGSRDLSRSHFPSPRPHRWWWLYDSVHGLR
jgi:hypothetical protein